jgi:hypothetical protein
VVAGLAAASCSGFATSVSSKREMEPLAIYAQWWVATEACSGRTGEFADITWFSAAAISSNESFAVGLWRPPHEIVIVRGYEEDERTVRHEMLHDLIGGDPGHDDSAWLACELAPG